LSIRGIARQVLKGDGGQFIHIVKISITKSRKTWPIRQKQQKYATRYRSEFFSVSQSVPQPAGHLIPCNEGIELGNNHKQESICRIVSNYLILAAGEAIWPVQANS